MSELNISQTDLSRLLHVGQSTVSRWLNGAVPQPRSAIPLAAALSVRMNWLLHGKGEKDLDEKEIALRESKILGGNPLMPIDEPPVLREDSAAYHARPPNAGGVRWVRLLSWAHAGAATTYEELPQDWQEEVPVPKFIGRAFALRIQGDSMEPRCIHGDCVIVVPDEEPQTGNLVVAKMRNDGIVLRRYSLLSAGRIQLTPYNPIYPTTDHTPEEFHWIYPVHSTLRLER
jgi:SOS-response transcriptional repressor LexA